MFDDYLREEQNYIQLEQYLYDRFLLACNEEETEIKELKAPFYNTAFSDGTPFRDGNSIFSARNEITGRILRIVLDEDVDLLVLYRDKDMGCELVIIARVGLLEHITEKMAEWLRAQ